MKKGDELDIESVSTTEIHQTKIFLSFSQDHIILGLGWTDGAPTNLDSWCYLLSEDFTSIDQVGYRKLRSECSR